MSENKPLPGGIAFGPAGSVYTKTGPGSIDTGAIHRAPLESEVAALRAERADLAARLAEVTGEFQGWVAQHGCNCGHPACKRCRDTAEAARVLAAGEGREP